MTTGFVLGFIFALVLAYWISRLPKTQDEADAIREATGTPFLKGIIAVWLVSCIGLFFLLVFSLAF